MMTYLSHPQHGTHIAYTQDEVERLTRLYGWSVIPEPQPKPRVEASRLAQLPQIAQPVATEHAQPERKRRGPYKKRRKAAREG